MGWRIRQRTEKVAESKLRQRVCFIDGRWDDGEGGFPCVQEYGNENILVGKMAGAGHCFGIYVQSSYRYKSIYSSRIRLENKDENSLLAKIIR